MYNVHYLERTIAILTRRNAHLQDYTQLFYDSDGDIWPAQSYISWCSPLFIFICSIAPHGEHRAPRWGARWPRCSPRGAMLPMGSTNAPWGAPCSPLGEHGGEHDASIGGAPCSPWGSTMLPVGSTEGSTEGSTVLPMGSTGGAPHSLGSMADSVLPTTTRQVHQVKPSAPDHLCRLEHRCPDLTSNARRLGFTWWHKKREMGAPNRCSPWGARCSLWGARCYI